MRAIRKHIFTVLIVLLLLLNVGLWMGLVPRGQALFSWSYWRSLSRIGEVMRVVNTNYADEQRADYDQLRRDALKQMVGSLDRYSTYMTREDFERFEMDTNQQYVGIGVQVERMDSRVTIVRVFPGSPAEEAGMEAGDQIVAVGGEDTDQAGLEEVVTLLKGAPGTVQDVSLYRPLAGERFTVEVERRAVDLPSVTDVSLREDGIGSIQITQFGNRTGEEFREALERLEGQGMRGLILDLRGNPGGLLPAAVDVAGEFLEEGRLVTYTEGRMMGPHHELRSETPAREKQYPLAVLINRHSASASEIVAGALQDWGRAVIVGEPSVGKGSVQSIIEVSGGEAVKLTTARYFLPNGRTIAEVGVRPDVYVPMDSRVREKLFLQRSHLREMGEDAFRQEYGYTPLQDPQEEAAVAALKGLLRFRPVDGEGT